MLALTMTAAALGCVPPGQCTPPSATTSRVFPMHPRKQWGNAGGFCGSLSVQSNALMFGNYISQDQVRKATDHGQGHGSVTKGFEILPTNIEQAMGNLALTYDSWDYNATKPQATAYKNWMKAHLMNMHPVVWFVMCKGDGDQVPYPGSNPNGGRFSHIEPVWGVFTNHSPSDPTAYDDDWLVHGSDWDQFGYYRPFHTLVDEPTMDGNCKNAGTHVGTNEAYPCIYSQVDYGYAITGNMDPTNVTFPAMLSVDSYEEPNVSEGAPPKPVKGTLTVSKLTPGSKYVIYRYKGKENVPRESPFNKNFESSHQFTAQHSTYVFADPTTFMSDTATYYRVIAA